MPVKKTVLLSGVILLLAILPFVMSRYRGKTTLDLPPSEYIPITEVLPAHEGRIKERVDLLKKQTLEETFVYLLDDQQYSYPGYYPAANFVPMDIERVLSTRSSLKVLQQFDALPREQATKKLRELSQKAIDDFKVQTANVRYIADAKECEEWEKAARANPTTAETGNVKYPLCVSLLLAARMGEYQLLVQQLNEMQVCVDAMIDHVRKDSSFPPEAEWMFSYMIPLDNDCVLTILMHALKRAGKDTDVPLTDDFIKKTIPLCRWDAALTHYDFAVWHGDKRLDPKDVIEQIIVYVFSETPVFEDPDGQKKKMIHTLKERLLK